ncbi:hypothetical protein BHE16_04975 [Neomicrococcus aestuarii]|uniref:Methylamine utilisation protein MauE domain-containing protein n=1 Tax=Neomicrococcus aestuarii TaxID=556325 RepID=A0A1L2ZN69_9MICC|nr:hypothetical protein BHE16_04975 [Neomicrococcus aestuarii]
MGILWFSAIPTLVVVLLVSGFAKLKSPASTDEAFASLQVPQALSAPVFRRGLPWAEIALGLALLITWGWVHTLATLATLVLFVAYLVLVAKALQRNDGASCNCFGEWSQAPVSGSTLIRNYVLVAAALVAFVGSFTAAATHFSWIQQLGGSGWLYVLSLLIPATVVAAILWDSLRSDSSSTTTPLGWGASSSAGAGEGSQPRSDDEEVLDYLREPIPYHSLTKLDGSKVTLRQLVHSNAVFMVKLSPGCGSCVMVMNQWESLAKRLHPIKLQAVVADPNTIPAELSGHDPAFIPQPLIDENNDLSNLFEQYGTPWAVVLGADKLLAAGPVAGSGAIFEIVDEIEAQMQEAAVETEDVQS